MFVVAGMKGPSGVEKTEDGRRKTEERREKREERSKKIDALFLALPSRV